MEKQIDSFTTMIKQAIEKFQGQVGSLEDEIVLLKRALLQGTSSTLEPIPTKVRVLKPKPFGGARNAKDLENFLQDMEQYFSVVRIPANEQVTITFMYLFGNAKLWRCDDATVERPRINT